MKHGLGIVCIVLLALVTSVGGQPVQDQGPNTTNLWPVPSGAEPGPSGEMFLKTLLALGLVIGLGLAVHWGLRRVGPKLGSLAGREVRVVETVPLGHRKALHLVQVCGRRILIGSTMDRIVMLASVDEPALHTQTGKES